MAAAAIGAATPDLKVVMKLTQPQVGLLAGTFFVAVGLSLPFVGRAVDRYGPTVCVLIGLIVSATSVAVFALLLGIAHVLTWCLRVQAAEHGRSMNEARHILRQARARAPLRRQCLERSLVRRQFARYSFR